MRMEMTDAKIGRSMKNAEIFMAAQFDLAVAAASVGRGAHGRHVRFDLDSRPHPLQAADDDHFIGFEALAHDPQATVEDAARRDGPILQLVVGAQHQDEILTLIGAHGAVFDEDGVVLAAAEQLDAGKHSGRELAVLVFEHCPGPDRPGADIELVVDEVHVAFVRKPLLVGEANFTGFLASRELGRSPSRANWL